MTSSPPQTLGAERFENLVSALSMVIGCEAFIVLSDVRGLDHEHAEQVSVAAALALIDAAMASAPPAAAAGD